jgi:hypothetical protein
MIPFNTDISLEDVGRVKNSLDPLDPQDLVTKSWFLANISSGSGFQKYRVQSGDTYTIPQFISSVVTGPFEIEGILEINGRLEIL